MAMPPDVFGTKINPTTGFWFRLSEFRHMQNGPQHFAVRITTIATTRYDASRPLAAMDRDQYEGAVGYTG
jgi:hypothetical protein